MLLEQLVETYDAKNLSEELNEIASTISLYEDAIATLDTSNLNSLFDMMGDAIEKFTAARRGIGIANKLKDAKERKKHTGNILKVMNKLRSLMSKIDKRIAALGGKTTITEAKNSLSFNKLDNAAQKVWDAQLLEDKKFALTEMVNSFNFSGKVNDYKTSIDNETSTNKLDVLAVNLMQEYYR